MPARGFDSGTALLVSGLGVVLVAGFVVLAALGRDTTGYMLFLGGPAVTAVVGALLSRRVATVATALHETQGVAIARVESAHTALDDHLTVQDETLGQLAAAVDVIEHPEVAPAPGLPAARDGRVSPFGPVSSGLVEQLGRPQDGR